jgi:DNA-binding LacI/PurR family transcriptional regulator
MDRERKTGMDIKTLARHLSLSIGTVSRALNGKPDVNPETRKRVLEAAAELGYAANQSGRSLRQGKTNTIGFLMELSESANTASDDFFMGLFDGVQSVLLRHELDLVIFPCSTTIDPVRYLQRIMRRNFMDALIISATRRNDARVDFLKQVKVPFIALGRSEGHPDIRWIDLDFEGAAETAVDRLVAQGHRRIAIALPDDDVNFASVFREGYQRALARHGIPYDPEIVIKHAPTLSSGEPLAKPILAVPNAPTAVILLGEWLASGLYEGLREHGKVPGRDIAVIGFRNNPRSKHLSPSLTCFSMPLFDLGQTVAETLLAGMPSYAHHYQGRDNNIVFPVQLAAGESDDFLVSG